MTVSVSPSYTTTCMPGLLITEVEADTEGELTEWLARWFELNPDGVLHIRDSSSPRAAVHIPERTR